MATTNFNDTFLNPGESYSRYGRISNTIGNIGGLFGSSSLQDLSAFLRGENDVTSGKMMSIARKLHFAGSLLGGQNTAIGKRLLRGRDFFERNRSFASDFLRNRAVRGGNGNNLILQNNALNSSNQNNLLSNNNSSGSLALPAPSSTLNLPALSSGANTAALSTQTNPTYSDSYEGNPVQMIRERRRTNKLLKKIDKKLKQFIELFGDNIQNNNTTNNNQNNNQESPFKKFMDWFKNTRFGRKIKIAFKKGWRYFKRGLIKIGPLAGKAIGVAAAGYIGWKVGSFLNEKLTDWMENSKAGQAFTNFIDDNWLSRKIQKHVFGVDKEKKDVADKSDAANASVKEIENPLSGVGENSLTNTQRALLYQGRLTEDHLTDGQKAILKEKTPDYVNTLAKIREKGGHIFTDGSTGKQRYEARLQKGEVTATSVEEDRAEIAKEREKFKKVTAPVEQTPTQNEGALAKQTPAQAAAVAAAALAGQGEIKLTQATGMSLGDIVASHEGTYDDVNRGAAHGYKSAKRDLTKMSVEKVMELQDAKDFNAAGKPQVIRDTLRELVKKGVVDPKAMFDEKTQNDILVHLMEKRAGGYITGRHNNINASLDDISKEWASVENVYTGRSYYDKDGVNKAHTSAADVGKGLEQARTLYQQNIAAGMPHKEAFRAAVLGQQATATQSTPGEIKPQPKSDAAKIAALSEVTGGGAGKIASPTVGAESELFGLKMNKDGSIAKESISKNFSTWGKVDLTGMNPLFMSRANSFADEFKALTGENIVATEGHRSKAEQERLYNLYKAGKGNLAAVPGTSNHGHGLAMDLSAKTMEAVLRKHPEVIKQLGAKNARDAIDKLAAKHGLHRPMKHRKDEQQHFEMIKDQEYKDNINEAMVAEVRNNLQSGSLKGSEYLKEGAGQQMRTSAMAQDSLNQEVMSMTPPVINVPQQQFAPSANDQNGGAGGGAPFASPMGAGTQDPMMAFMFGAYGYPVHIG